MLCPDCNSNTKVIDSRSQPGFVYRRRKCKSCGMRFSTEEKISIPERIDIYVVIEGSTNIYPININTEDWDASLLFSTTIVVDQIPVQVQISKNGPSRFTKCIGFEDEKEAKNFVNLKNDPQ